MTIAKNSSSHRKSSLQGQMAILAAAVFWSTSGLFIKFLDWHPIVISGARSVIATAFLLILRLLVPNPKTERKSAALYLVSGILFAFMIYTFITANKLTTVANVILLQYSGPIWGALLGWWLVKEKPHWEHWLALVFVMGGLLLFFRDSLDPGAFMGNLLAIISGVLMGAHTVSLRMFKDSDPRDAMIVAHMITALLAIPFFFFYPPTLNVSTVLPILYMGLLQMGLASFLLSYGIKRTTAIQAMLTAIIDPVLSPIWVLLIIGEKPSLSALAGGVIIVTAVIASSVIGMRREEGHKT